MVRRLITKAEFARLCGVSRAAIIMAAKRGTFPIVTNDGKDMINLDDLQIQDYMKIRGVQPPDDLLELKKINKEPYKRSEYQKKPETKKPPKTQKPPQSDTPPEPMGPMEEKTILQNEKTRKQIEKMDFDLKKARGELINRDTVKVFFGKLVTIDHEQLLPIPETIAADLAGSVFKSDDPEKIKQTEDLIRKAIFRVQKNKKRVVKDMIKGLEE